MSGMCVGGKWQTNLAIDELDVVRALRVAVSSAVLGSSLVCRVFGHTTILVHFDEVKGSVQAAGQLRGVDVKGELLVEELEHLVLGIRGHKIQPRTDAPAERTIGDKLKRKSATGRSHSVRAGVVCSIEGAITSTCFAVRAEGSVPRVATVAVRGFGRLVQPTPVGIERDLGLERRAAAGRALLDGQRRVIFRGQNTDLLR